MKKKSKRGVVWVIFLTMVLVSLVPAGMAFAKAEESSDAGRTEPADTVNNASESTVTDTSSDSGLSDDPANATKQEEAYSAESVEIKSGFFDEDGEKVYYVDGKKITGFRSVGEETYYFSKPDGYMLKGLQNIGDYKYYFDKKTGVMLRGIVTIEKQKYYFSEKTGRMLKGFRTVGDNKYYFSSKSAKMLFGLQTIKGDKYYFDPQDGHQITGFVTTADKTRYFDEESGKMVKGFTKVGNDKYYFKESNGKMLTGLKKINGNKYYFDEDTGKLIHGFKKINGSKYYFGKNTGRMVFGFVKINGSKYYFGKSSGKMFTGIHKIGKNVYTFNKKGKLTRTVYGNKKAICLTWDDGPSENTATIRKALINNGGRGTFFVCGSRVDAYSKTLKSNYKAGNQIGNHTWDHPVLSNLSADGIKNEISSTNNKVKKYTGVKPTVCRTPYGINTEFVRTNVNMPIILWSADTLDWKTRNSTSTYNSIMSNAKDGAVVLMHDLYSETAAAAVKAIPDLVAKGYQLVTVEEMALLKGTKLKKAVVYYKF